MLLGVEISVHLQTHAVVYLVVSKRDMVLEDSVPVKKTMTLVTLGEDHKDTIATHHFFSWILLGSVPVCAAMSFLRSPTVSS